jgi:hypothetical protein
MGVVVRSDIIGYGVLGWMVKDWSLSSPVRPDETIQCL